MIELDRVEGKKKKNEQRNYSEKKRKDESRRTGEKEEGWKQQIIP